MAVEWISANKKGLYLPHNVGSSNSIKRAETKRRTLRSIRAGQGYHSEIGSGPSWELNSRDGVEGREFIGTPTGPNFNINDFMWIHDKYPIGKKS